uniref:Uncharacterized protein n=1 Tax=Anguilla anguilla TaxID=7936 RepID=A0A0E9QT70_ANGAN
MYYCMMYICYYCNIASILQKKSNFFLASQNRCSSLRMKLFFTLCGFALSA